MKELIVLVTLYWCVCFGYLITVMLEEKDFDLYIVPGRIWRGEMLIDRWEKCNKNYMLVIFWVVHLIMVPLVHAPVTFWIWLKRDRK